MEESVFMADRLADTQRFYGLLDGLLDRLEDRIGGKRKLADCNGRMTLAGTRGRPGARARYGNG